MAGYREEYFKKLDGGGCLYEVDILKIILGNAYGGKDMSAVAEALLARFPGVRSVIEADEKELLAVDGVTQPIASYLKTLDLALKLCHKSEIYIKSTEQCFKVAFSRFRSHDNECMEIYLTSKTGKVVDIRTYTSFRANRVEVSASEVYSAIVGSKAHGAYLVHNHINCSATPSDSDDAVTEKFGEACGMCGITFYDHCIISSTGDKFSYAESGRLAKIKQNIRL